MANITDTIRLSDRLHEKALALAGAATESDGITLSLEDCCDLVSWMQQRSAEARALERMLERRLKASDIPGAGGAPLPAPRVPAPPLPANEPGSNLVMFRPRSDARLVPFEGGAA